MNKAEISKLPEEFKQSLINRDKYYHSYSVLRNITQLLRFRYFAYSNRDKDIIIEKPVRDISEGNIKGGSVKILKVHMARYFRGHHHIEFLKMYDKYRFADISYLRLYMCLTKLKTSFPILPTRGVEREKVKEDIRINLGTYVEGYDMAWDFDMPESGEMTLLELRNQVLEFIKFFDRYNVAYSVTFSGRRGFHVRIPADYLHPLLQKNFERTNNISHKIELFHNTFSFHLVKNDLMKLWKLPYSVDGKLPNFYVVMPLTITQLRDFDKNDYMMEKVIKGIKLVDKNQNPRGECMIKFTDMNAQRQATLDMSKDIESW